MPKYYRTKICGYYLYYTSSCLVECMHVHASDSKLTEEGYSVIFTTHTPDHALLMGGTTAILHMGGKLTVGPAGQIVSEDTLYGLYGVPLFLDYARKARRTACVAPPI